MGEKRRRAPHGDARLELNLSAEGDLDLDRRDAGGGLRNEVAGDFLAVDDERLHALGLTFRVLDLNGISDAAELTGDAEAFPFLPAARRGSTGWRQRTTRHRCR